MQIATRYIFLSLNVKLETACSVPFVKYLAVDMDSPNGFPFFFPFSSSSSLSLQHCYVDNVKYIGERERGEDS